MKANKTKPQFVKKHKKTMTRCRTWFW